MIEPQGDHKLKDVAAAAEAVHAYLRAHELRDRNDRIETVVDATGNFRGLFASDLRVVVDMTAHTLRSLAQVELDHPGLLADLIEDATSGGD